MKAFLTFALLGFVSFGVIQCNKNQGSSQFKDLKFENLIEDAFGVAPGEVVLTLDDGPGGRTEELADWLVKHDIPATFFMVGENAARYKSVLNQLKDMSLSNHQRAFVIANHTMSHEDETSATAYASQILQADKILSPYVTGDFFFRPPYGNLIKSTWLRQRAGESESEFKRRKEAAYREDIARINALNRNAGVFKYYGPVLWNVGTAITSEGYAADWECWTLSSSNSSKISQCTDGYLKEIKARKAQGLGAVVLAHDIHSLTIDMLIGTGAAHGRSLLLELKKQGFQFVALDRYPEKYRNFFTDNR